MHPSVVYVMRSHACHTALVGQKLSNAPFLLLVTLAYLCIALYRCQIRSDWSPYTAASSLVGGESALSFRLQDGMSVHIYPRGLAECNVSGHKNRLTRTGKIVILHQDHECCGMMTGG